MFKFFCRLLVFTMIFQTISEVAHAATGNVTAMVNKAFAPVGDDSKNLFPKDWFALKLMEAAIAEQNAQQRKASDPQVVETPTVDWPTFPGKPFEWKNPGADPAIDPVSLPNFGKGDMDADIRTIQNVVLGKVGFENQTKIFWATTRASLYNGRPIPADDVAAIKRIVATDVGGLTLGVIAPGLPLRCRMSHGTKISSSGDIDITLSQGLPFLPEDEKPLDAYFFKGFMPTGGLYKGLGVSLVWPVICGNIVCVEASLQNSDPEPTHFINVLNTYVDVRRNTYVDVKSKKAIVPDRDELQSRVMVTDAEGKSLAPVEMWNNKKVSVAVPDGTYTIRETIRTTKWEIVGNDTQTVKVDGKDVDVTFEKMRLPDEPEQTAQVNPFAAAMSCPPEGCKDGRDGKDGKNGKGMPKWLIPLIGGIAAVAIVGLLLPKGGDKTIITPPGCKGNCSSGPGGNTLLSW